MGQVFQRVAWTLAEAGPQPPSSRVFIHLRYCQRDDCLASKKGSLQISAENNPMVLIIPGNKCFSLHMRIQESVILKGKKMSSSY